MIKIHPSAVVEEGAVLADGVEIGPLCYVGPNVKIGAGTKLIAQCHLSGYTTLGENNTLYPFTSLGQNAQDYAVEPGATYLNIGSDNIFREGTAIHSGTKPNTATCIGNHCMFMNGSHVAHNCVVGNNVIMVSLSVLGGYAQVADRALISGLVAVHQFCRVGRLAILSGGSAFSKDVPPFMMAEGRNGGVKMINLVGLKRSGMSEENIRILKNLYKIYFREELNASKALERIKNELPQIPEVLEFIEFCATSKRGVLSGRNDGHRG